MERLGRKPGEAPRRNHDFKGEIRMGDEGGVGWEIGGQNFQTGQKKCSEES